MTTADMATALTPYEVAAETFLIPWHLPAPPVGYFPMHSLVIRGSEPVLVDTGAPASREAWLEAAWSVVDPEDVRWVFLSHDDRDHAGNLMAVLEACPNATLLTSWFAVGRMFEEWATPLDRCRFVNTGDRVDVGDRTLVAMRPPVFDNPTTRGLMDTSTGVYWGVDTFATNVPEPMYEADALPEGEFLEGQMFGGRLVAPWHTLIDEAKFGAYVNDVQRLGMSVVAGCHTPVLRGTRLDAAFDVLRALPGLDPWPEFSQDDLDAWMGAAEAAVPVQEAHQD
ncbi:MAG: MBL fold metallo-hydrolase [Actinomycetes bacterium]